MDILVLLLDILLLYLFFLVFFFNIWLISTRLKTNCLFFMDIRALLPSLPRLLVPSSHFQLISLFSTFFPLITPLEFFETLWKRLILFCKSVASVFSDAFSYLFLFTSLKIEKRPRTKGKNTQFFK
jgi:hypothetical protein